MKVAVQKILPDGPNLSSETVFKLQANYFKFVLQSDETLVSNLNVSAIDLHQGFTVFIELTNFILIATIEPYVMNTFFKRMPAE